MSKSEAHDRRQHRRVPASLLPSLTARLSGGAAVTLLDVSRRGVRLQTTMHMRPGQTVCIRFVAADATVTLTAAVVRATVAHVEADGIRYETALSLAGDLLLCEHLEDAARQSETEPMESHPMPQRQAIDDVVDFTMVVNGTTETGSLIEGLHGNSW